jgi:ABC-type antimicrobial peptide transport system permease subunit
VISAAAILLTVIGVYAAAAAAVAERTREMGIRAALGAAPSGLRRLVLRQGMFVAATGAIAGIAGSALAARLLTAQLFGVASGDVVLLIPAVTTLLVFVALAAVLPAAQRAARIDPVTAMRVE